MPRTKKSDTKSEPSGSVVVEIGTAAPAAQTELEKALARIAELEAQAAGQAKVERSYPEPETPKAIVAYLRTHGEFEWDEPSEEMFTLAGNLRNLMHRMVVRVPGSPVTKTHPFGTAVTEPSKNSPAIRLNKMKPGIDRGDYIKLRDLIEQLTGKFGTYESPRDLSDDQINKVLRPVLDNCKKAGLISW